MQFSDTTNKNGLIELCEHYTRLGDAKISGDSTLLKKFTMLINNRYHEAVTMVLESAMDVDFDDPNHANTSFKKTYNLSANTQYVALPLSDKILKIKRVEVSYDGTNYYRAFPIDDKQIGIGLSQANINGTFSQTQPYYDYKTSYIYLYPIPTSAVTNGLSVWVTREIDEFASSDTTQQPAIARPFRPMLAIGASLDWVKVHRSDDTILISQLEKDYLTLEARLKKHYGRFIEEEQLNLQGVIGLEDYA